jgi:hypothetical protein
MASPDFSDSMPHLHICTLFETTLLHLSVYIETTKCTLKLWTPWPRLSVHIETTDSNGLMCLCILKLRTPMALCACAYWNYGLHGLICPLKLQILWPHLSVEDRTESSYSQIHAHSLYIYVFNDPVIRGSFSLLHSPYMCVGLCTYWQPVKNNRVLCLPYVCKNILHGKYSTIPNWKRMFVPM